jgi:hypothetical protein
MVDRTARYQKLTQWLDSAVTFLLSLRSSVTLALSPLSFTVETGLFPSALPIFSNSCANDARGGTTTSSSSTSSSDAGDGERFGAADACACALVLDLPLRMGSKRRRGVQSSDGEKSGCSGWSFEREFLETPKCGFWKARRLPRLKKDFSPSNRRKVEQHTRHNKSFLCLAQGCEGQ